jgi:hypothetical protein
MSTQMISHDFHGKAVRQRSDDGYFDATAMCKATGKRWNNYYRLDNTKEFLKELSSVIEIPVTLISATEQNQELIQIIQGGSPQFQGTWVHPYISINLAQWCNPRFAVHVAKWVFELMTTGKVELHSGTPSPQMLAYSKATAELLENFGIVGNAKTIALNNSLKKEFGYDALKEWGLTYLTAEVQQQLLTVSDIAKRLDLKTREINPLLIAEGLQTVHRDHKNRVYYELTDKGMIYAVYQDTSKKRSSGVPVRSIKWYESVTGLLS